MGLTERVERLRGSFVVKTFDFGRSWRVTPVDSERDMARKLCGIAAGRAGRMQRLMRDISMSLWIKAYTVVCKKERGRGGEREM